MHFYQRTVTDVSMASSKQDEATQGMVKYLSQRKKQALIAKKKL
jgi:hypothetical protein